ncbi:MAG: hypothetical protein MK165_13970 [Pirellulaceae bacterium]|nr:hypothetical protein [Pirellulaceae bacterium]
MSDKQPDVVRLWKFPREDFDDWIDLISESEEGAPMISDYDQYISAIDDIAHQAYRMGVEEVQISTITVDEMRQLLDENEIPNTVTGRAEVTASLSGDLFPR